MTHKAPARTILVLEDRYEDYELLEQMVRRSNILNPIKHVETVAETIRYLKGEDQYADRARFPFPLMMLLDIRVPDGSGYDVLRWLAQNDGSKPRAVVVLTGSDVSAIRRAYADGANSFLVKPIRFEDFENMTKAVRGIRLTKTDGSHVLE